MSSRSLGARLGLRVKTPGTYRLGFGEIPGYRPVPEEVLAIDRGQVLERVIDLRRR